jgi:hypothetical protein
MYHNRFNFLMLQSYTIANLLYICFQYFAPENSGMQCAAPTKHISTLRFKQEPYPRPIFNFRNSFRLVKNLELTSNFRNRFKNSFSFKRCLTIGSIRRGCINKTISAQRTKAVIGSLREMASARAVCLTFTDRARLSTRLLPSFFANSLLPFSDLQSDTQLQKVAFSSTVSPQWTDFLPVPASWLSSHWQSSLATVSRSCANFGRQ